MNEVQGTSTCAVQPGLPPTDGAPTHLHATESGDWLSAEVLHERACAALVSGAPMHLDVSGVDYLPASVLQILLALAQHLTENACSRLVLTGVSAGLSRWFTYAGASWLVDQSGLVG